MKSLISEPAPAGKYYFERHTFTSESVDDVVQAFRDIGFKVTQLDDHGDGSYELECVKPWSDRPCRSGV